MARNREIPPDLVAELESQSRYTSDNHGGHPLILRHRIATLRSGTYHVLSRIHESGTDYSKRNNHLAHHLAIRAEDAAGLPNPAAILLNWRGWRSEWNEPPRILEASESFALNDLESLWAVPPIPKKIRSVNLAQDPRTYVFSISLQEEKLLVEYLRQTINALPTEQRWTHPFTSCLLPTDQPHDYVWSGRLNSLQLPYEVDSPARSLLPEPEPAPEPPAPQEVEEAAGDTPDPDPSAPQTNAALLKKAPRVEVPEAYDKKKRRRPKRRFGRREFSRAINIAIVGAALICVALLFFFVQSHRNSAVAHGQSSSDNAADQALKYRQQAWQRFADAGYPGAQLEDARATAAFLAKAGEDAPYRTIAFLDKLQNPEAPELQEGLQVPKRLIQADGQQASLPLTTISYPALRQLALLPASLLADWDLAADPSSGLSPLAALAPTTYSPAAFGDALDAYQFQADDAFQALPDATRRALASYFQQKQALANNPQFAPVLDIHTAFRLGPEHAFIAFDEQGRLIPGSSMSLARYLNELVATYLQQSDDRALQSTLFRQALVLAQQQDEPIEVAAAIHQAFATLDLSARPSTDPLLQIRTLWDAAFLRQDLMEQTILGYTLQALEAAKLQLAQTRSQFSQRELALYLESKTRAAQIERLKRAATPVQSTKEWVVISKQSPQLHRSEP